jgi:hypothetical protein
MSLRDPFETFSRRRGQPPLPLIERSRIKINHLPFNKGAGYWRTVRL